jgi:hypothetical protein
MSGPHRASNLSKKNTGGRLLGLDSVLDGKCSDCKGREYYRMFIVTPAPNSEGIKGKMKAKDATIAIKTALVLVLNSTS